jgi:iron uptake system component EfeO
VSDHLRTTLSLACLATIALAGPTVAQDEVRVPVTVNDAGCEPAALEVRSGVVVFEVTNGGGDVGEFEVLEGDRVVDEVENILPGFVINLPTRLDGGTYETVCYTLTSPRGSLTVTGGAAPAAPASTVVEAAVLDGYRQAYQDWVNERAATLVEDVERFADAILAGDLDTARSLYAPTRVAWEEIEPIAELFADIDVAVDAREEDFAGGVDDPEFRGFHRIERILWVEDASGDLATLAEELVANVRDLRGRLAELVIEPRIMARGAGELNDEVAQSKLTGEEDRYSETDLWSIDANLAGAERIVDLLRPTLETLDRDRLGRIDAAFASVRGVMTRYAEGDGFAPFSAISPEDLTALQAGMAGLSEQLAPLPGVLGLSA